MNTLIENIVHEEIESLINESLSENLYHFTDIDPALNIMQKNEMHLTSIYEGYGDNEIFSNKLFYMCFTREKARVGGYGLAGKKPVRMVFDGDKLRQNFSGKAIDFFGKGGLSGRSYYMRLKRKPNEQPDVESEDRLFSNKGVIKNIKKYIKRVDVFIGVENRNDGFSQYNLNRGLKMCDTIFSDILYFYNNINDFKFQTKNVFDINKNDFYVEREKESIKQEEKNEYHLNEYNESVILRNIVDVLNAFYKYDIKHQGFIKNPNLFFIDLFKKFGFEKYIDYIKEYVFEYTDEYININECIRNIGSIDKDRYIYNNFCRMVKYLFKTFNINNSIELFRI